MLLAHDASAASRDSGCLLHLPFNELSCRHRAEAKYFPLAMPTGGPAWDKNLHRHAPIRSSMLVILLAPLPISIYGEDTVLDLLQQDSSISVQDDKLTTTELPQS
jgi:hypothetical protein